MSLTPSLLTAQSLEEEVHYETMAPHERAIIIDAQVRARGEYRHGAISPRRYGEEAAMFVNERTRLGFGYAANGVQLQISAQHAGVWGSQGINGASNGLSLNEAWGRIYSRNNAFSAQIGRQVLSYDNGRILGNNDWSATGNSHNALRLAYEDEWNKVHILGSININKENVMGCYYNDSITCLYKNMVALWYHFGNNASPVEASVLLMNEGHETGNEVYPSTEYKQTMGAMISYHDYKFGASAEGYYQRGKGSSLRKTSAWMAAIEAHYTPNSKWRFNAGFDYISGTKVGDEENHSFMPTYGSFHNFHGGMQYFGQSYLTKEGHQGVMDTHAGMRWSPTNNLNINGNYHFLSVSVDQVQMSHEVDFSADWHFRKDVTLSAGYSFAMNTKNMNYLLGGYNKAWQDFGYIQLNFSPRILFHKW